MKAKWTSLIVAGTVLLVLSSQAMAQPWGGPGRGQGFGRGQGMGRMGQGPGPLWQQGQQGGPQDEAGTWCPYGFAPRGRGAWNTPGQGRLGLGRGGRGSAFQGGANGPAGPGFWQGRGRGGRMGSRGRGPGGQPFADGWGRGARRGMRPRWGLNQPDTQTQQSPTDVWNGRPRQGWNRNLPQGPGGQGPAGQPFADGRGAGRGMRPRQGLNRPDTQAQEPSTDGQDVSPVQPRLRRVPPIEQMFDQADTNDDGALTKDEIRAFHENLGPGAGWGRQAR